MGIWEADLIHGTTIGDEMAAEIFGQAPPNTREEFFERIHPEDRPRVAAALEAADSADTPYDAEFRIVTPAGETRWVHASGSVLRVEKDEPIRMIGVVVDITELKRAGIEVAELLAR
jgi:PAS domain S-box-containing protein